MIRAEIDPGTCIAFGASNARIAACANGDIANVASTQTPNKPDEFFKWMARGVLDAAHSGSQWLIAGFPGPVSPDGKLIGPFVNIGGMNEGQYSLVAELAKADPEVSRTLEQGFTFLPVNDGTLAAHAAASRVGEHTFGKTGALIFGTGVGAGIVEKDPAFTNVHRVDVKNPLEIGQIMIGDDAKDTYETRYSGSGIKKTTGFEPEELPADHPAWAKQGRVAGGLATQLGLMNGVELVVPTGGIGGGASDKLRAPLLGFMKEYKKSGNGTQQKCVPEVRFMDPSEAQVFELYGAEGVMLDYTTQSPASPVY